MFTVGSFVEFNWWSCYRAPSVYPDSNFNTTWHEVKPGDTGVVIGHIDEVKHSVLFISVPGIPLTVHVSMLKLA